jgi:hypothetical protein
MTQAAVYIDQSLKGAKLFDQPTNFETVINLKTAKPLGATIPQSVLLRAADGWSSEQMILSRCASPPRRTARRPLRGNP